MALLNRGGGGGGGGGGFSSAPQRQVVGLAPPGGQLPVGHHLLLSPPGALQLPGPRSSLDGSRRPQTMAGDSSVAEAVGGTLALR